MGMDDTQWRDASYLQDLLSTLQEQRECDVDAKDVKGRRTGYFYAARSMFRYTFRTSIGPFYDAERKCLWHLGWKVSLQTLQLMRALVTDDLSQGPKEREDPELDVRATYHILQRSHYLHLYADSEAQPSKRIAKFDMLKPKQRQAFVEIRRLTAQKYPPTQTSSPPKHKSLLRVQGLCTGGHERQRAKKLAHAKGAALRETSRPSTTATTSE